MKLLTKLLFTAAALLFINTAFAETQNRHLTGFNAIQLSGSYDVYITQGATESVNVEAPANVIDKIITEVQGGVLKIYSRNENGWGNWFGSNKKMAIYINAKDINSIGVSGSGDVFFKDGITTNSLKIRISGSGDVLGKVHVKNFEAGVSGSGDLKVSGRADYSNITVSGSGDVSAHDLATGTSIVHVSGSGDATVYASEKIDASVSGSGDIRYAGSPKQVSTSTHGSGDIHRM
ncbi:putative autotransporter adhesin-like protein [Mucilaginibacter gracilis]|uniref:Putative autotransporter adhesin-like protein n=1 Tax=Mucilaginibacter gracilis TaxID=423350 RepID=A0A495IYJ6_9SPHI|nr:head GIN domain-containing protein [Mucilaginibacter gracilis]RKR81642.1 putative autotransporter adhesin-like protein [Mucilaginibacter gracilis]